MRSRIYNQRGDIAIYITILLISILFILAASLRLTLTAGTAEAGWDIHRQRSIEARSLAEATKESVLATAELAPVTSGNTFSSELNRRVLALANAAAGIVLTSAAGNTSNTVPSNPQWPNAAPLPTSIIGVPALTGIGRNLQAIISAGDCSDLGSQTYIFGETNTAFPTDSASYSITAHYFSVPLTNFTWVAYGRPTAPGGVMSGTPSAPTFTKGSGFTAPLATGYAAEAGTFAGMLGSSAPALPYYYRDLVALTWNAYEYWIGLGYQNTLLTAAGGNVFDFSNPTVAPLDVTWNGTRATVNLNTAQASLLVFTDSVGGSILHLDGASGTGSPVVLAIRNFSSVPTTIELAGNNSRSVLLYAPNTILSPNVAGLNFRGGVLLFSNSQVSASLTVNGFVAYPQTQSPPAIIAYPDALAKHDLQSVVPHALLVSTRGYIQ